MRGKRQALKPARKAGMSFFLSESLRFRNLRRQINFSAFVAKQGHGASVPVSLKIDP